MKEVKKAPTKDDSKPTLEDIARIHIVLLQFGGILPIDKNVRHQVLQLFSAIFAHFCFTFTSSIYLWGFFKPIYEGHFNVGIIPQVIGSIGIQCRFVILYIKRAKILALFQFGKELWMNLNDSEIIITRNCMRKGVMLCYWYLSVCIILVMSYTMTSLLLNHHSEGNGTHRRHMVFPFFTDVQTSPWYEILQIIQVITHWGLDLGIAGVDTAATFFIMIACGYLKSLSHRIENIAKINDSSEQRNVEKEIIDCIIFHTKIIEYTDQIREVMSLLFFVQLVTTTYNISLDVLTIAKEGIREFKYIPLLTIQITQLLLCQWAPDYLVSESEYFNQSTYFVPFFGFSNKKFNQLIQILMLKSQTPITLLAGGFFVLSMESFKNLITSAWSFFSLLYNLN